MEQTYKHFQPMDSGDSQWLDGTENYPTHGTENLNFPTQPSHRVLEPAPGPGVRYTSEVPRAGSPDWDSQSDVGSTMFSDTGSMSSADHEDAIIRLVQENQVLRKCIEETNGRLREAEEVVAKAEEATENSDALRELAERQRKVAEEQRKAAEEDRDKTFESRNEMYQMFKEADNERCQLQERWRFASVVLGLCTFAAGVSGIMVGMYLKSGSRP